MKTRAEPYQLKCHPWSWDALFSFGLLSPLWHPKLLEKKPWEQEQDFLEGPLAACMGVGGLGVLFPLSVGGNAAPSSVPKAPLEYLGVELRRSMSVLSIPSPWRIFGLWLQKQDEVKLSTGVSSCTTGEGTASAPTSCVHPSLEKHHRNCVSTEAGEEPSHIWHHWLHLHQLTKQGQGMSAGSGPWLSIPSHFEHAEWHDFGPCQLAPSRATAREGISQGWSTLFWGPRKFSSVSNKLWHLTWPQSPKMVPGEYFLFL